MRLFDMMDYKFRGFDAVGSNGWVYGDLVHNKKVTKTGLEDRVMVGGYEVYPDSVGLMLCEKDGQMLYDGDIIKVDIGGGMLFRLTIEDGMTHAICEQSSEWEWVGFGLILEHYSFEVVGNVFESKR